MVHPTSRRPPTPLDAYFRAIRRIPLLSEAEETALGHRIQAGDRSAVPTLVYHNLRWAAAFARRQDPELWNHEPVWSLADTVQEATLGLWHAAHLFNPSYGRFTTYATYWIRQRVNRARYRFKWSLHIPVHALQDIETYRRTHHALMLSWGGSPPLALLVHRLEWPVAKVIFIATLLPQLESPIPLNQTLDLSDSSDASDLLEDIIADPTSADAVFENLRAEADHALVERLLATLSVRDAVVMRLRYGIDTDHPHTLQEIGDLLHLTRERIRQIEAKSLSRLQREVVKIPHLDPLAQLA